MKTELKGPEYLKSIANHLIVQPILFRSSCRYHRHKTGSTCFPRATRKHQKEEEESLLSSDGRFQRHEKTGRRRPTTQEQNIEENKEASSII
jgi:hypothetical protein